MSEQIQRYRFVVERDARGEFSRAYATPWFGSQEPGNDWVSVSDHEQDKAAAVARAVKEERERCRREEVEPLWRACGDVFSRVHSLTQILGLAPSEFETRVNKVLMATDAMIRIRANVGKVQSQNPVAAQQPADAGKEQSR